MHPVAYILLSLVLALSLGVAWFLADMRFAQRWSLKRAELGAQDKWRELNAHFEAGLKCRRPLLLLFQRFVIPGLVEADYALHLSNQGENERALVLAEKAARMSANRPEIQVTVSAARAMVLLRLGRYAEAQKIIQYGKEVLRDIPDSAKSAPNLGNDLVVTEALMEMNLGHLDVALQLGTQASAAAVTDPARAVVSAVLLAMGRFREALDALVYEASQFEQFLKPDDRELLAEVKLFAQTADKMNEELSGVFGPAIGLGRAAVFLEAGDGANLGEALKQAQAVLKSNRAMEHIFLRTRACCQAANGNIAGAEADLTRVRALTEEKPASRSAKYECHLATGRARLSLGYCEAAVKELEHASRLALHPLEKHTSNYWLARAHQAINPSIAANLFKAIVADGFSTWMENDSRARLAEIAG